MAASFVTRPLLALGADLALAPERHVASRLRGEHGVELGSLVVERNERALPRDFRSAVVLDTTHAKNGVIDMRAARASGAASSAKKRALEGDLLISRLRPYLRQIALVHPASAAETLVCSTEFHVLAGRGGGDLAFLLPFLLGAQAQAALAAGQEGGHHPRVPRETLLGLRVPRKVVGARSLVSRRVRAALDALYAAEGRYVEALAMTE